MREVDFAEAKKKSDYSLEVKPILILRESYPLWTGEFVEVTKEEAESFDNLSESKKINEFWKYRNFLNLYLRFEVKEVIYDKSLDKYFIGGREFHSVY